MGIERKIGEVFKHKNKWWRINLILNECGMNELDPRNAYDWLVLYSLNTNDTIGMNEKMEQVIQFLFPSH